MCFYQVTANKVCSVNFWKVATRKLDQFDSHVKKSVMITNLSIKTKSPLMINNSMIATVIVSFFLLAGCTYPTEKAKESGSSNSTEYNCEDGKKLHITYLPKREEARWARVRVEGTQYDLERVPSGSGEKYSNGKFIWWSKGSSGFLEIDDVIVIKGCRQ